MPVRVIVVRSVEKLVDAHDLDDLKEAALFLLALGEKLEYRDYVINHRYSVYQDENFLVGKKSPGGYWVRMSVTWPCSRQDYIRVMNFIDETEDKRHRSSTVEQRTCNAKVGSSNLSGGSNKGTI